MAPRKCRGSVCPPDVYVEALDPTLQDRPAFGDAVFTEVMEGECHGGGGGGILIP